MDRLDDSAKAPIGNLLEANYGALRRMARDWLRREARGHTLQATALVHEAWLRLASQGRRQELARGEFLGAAHGAMHLVLVDHARARGSEKRGGARTRVPLDRGNEPRVEAPTDRVPIDEALQRLAEVDGELARLVRLRSIRGFSEEEIARRLGVSTRTVRRQWQVAKMFLARELGEVAP